MPIALFLIINNSPSCWIKWSKEIVESGSTCQKCHSNKIIVLPMIYITIKLPENTLHPIDYITDIEEYYLNRSHNLTLKYIRIFNKGEAGRYHKHHIEYYNGKRYSPEELACGPCHQQGDTTGEFYSSLCATGLLQQFQGY